MRVAIKGSLLETALRIAAEQFRKDAAVAEKEGVHRTMDAFLMQAEGIEALIDYTNDEETVVIQPDWMMNDKTATTHVVDKLVRDKRRFTTCERCGEKQVDHVDGVKCPFESSLFKEKPS